MDESSRVEPQRERRELQERLSDWLDVPLSLLAVVMLGLLVIELTLELPPTWATRIAQAQMAIWAIFAAEFALEFALAPAKLQYLRRNWLTAISVLLPALRAVRLLRVARALRGLSLVRIITALNRGTRALGHIVRIGQFGHVLALTVVVTITAAAGAYYFERTEPGATILTFADGLWWAATIVTTINSPLETVTLEGRVIALLVRIYALAVSGYLTAAIAVYLLGSTARTAPPAPEEPELAQLRLAVARLEQTLAREWDDNRQATRSETRRLDGPDER